jgi:hypothetical protein
MSYIKSLDAVSQWGHYEVNGRKFYLVREAYEHANHVSEVRFNFHDDLFGMLRPHIEPKQSLDELYRKRVEQIRKKYDHVVLCYSGGADSHNILKYFELTGLHLDEIATIEDSSIRGRDSIISGEVFRVALPEAERFIEKFPATKLRLIDAREYQNQVFFSQQLDIDPVYNLSYQFKPVSTLFQGWWAYFVDDYKKLHEQGKRVGIIWAVDKPKIGYSPDHGWMLRFHDFHSMLGHKHATVKETFWDDEPFYWTPELPMLPIKQAHVVANYLNQTDAAEFNPTQGLDQPVNCIVRRSGKPLSFEYINPIIYPYWDPNTFTVGKERNNYFVSVRDTSLVTANDPEIVRYSQGVWASVEKFKDKIEFWKECDINPNSTSTKIAGIKHIPARAHPLNIK